MICRRLVLLFLCTLVLLPASPPARATVSADPSLSTYLPLVRRDRGGLKVDPKDRNASRAFFRDQYRTSEGTPILPTGNPETCDAGQTGQPFRDATLRRINYYRAMAGVPADVTFSERSISHAQKAALMMVANGRLSHFPDASWRCYSEEGVVGAGRSNLGLGRVGWQAIDAYMQDPGSGNYFVGHRRWILYPPTQQMGSGDIITSGKGVGNALWVIEGTVGGDVIPRDEFAAWPPPGYVPYQVVYPRWSFSLHQGNFEKATVTMTSGGSRVALRLEKVESGYADDTLVWIPLGLRDSQPWPKPAADTTYTVTVANVYSFRDGGGPFTYTYDVTVFDPDS